MVGLFATTLFLGSALLFIVEPMFAKMILPKLGGAPSVWSTCVVFYQAALLGGYLYAHYLSVRLRSRTQMVLHLVLLLGAAAVLPIRLRFASPPPDGSSPVSWLFILLTSSVGAPFFVLSATAPLLQRWFSRTSHPSAADPFFLYSASNLGSLIGLVTYPALLEPTLRLGTQSHAWSAAYLILFSLTGLCAAVVWRSSRDSVQTAQRGSDCRENDSPRRSPVTRSRRAYWTILALIPSSLMLSVTTYLTTDIAPVPLLWVIPLALYLLSFVVVFGRRRAAAPTWPSIALVMFGLPLASAFGRPSLAGLQICLHLATFFFAALVCHGRLADDRPSAAHVTDFYLWVSVGGVLGGLFNTLVAPVIFSTTLEYPLALIAAFLVRRDLDVSAWEAGSRRGTVLVMLVAVFLSAVLFGPAVGNAPTGALATLLGVLLLLVFFGAVSFRRRGYPSIAVTGLLLAAMVVTLGSASVLHRGRNFFGTHSVRNSGDGRFRTLFHGNTLHGVQALASERRDQPTGYYDRSGPLGDVFTIPMMRREGLRVAVLGLGAGGMACYAGPGQIWTFYEIDPAIERIARDARFFTFLRDCAPTARVVIGDARLSLVKAADRAFDVIALDVFSSDAIPMHLMTREAVDIYVRKLASGGMLVFHISNRYLDLAPIVGALARDAGLVGAIRRDARREDRQWPDGKQPSVWAVASATKLVIDPLLSGKEWQPISESGHEPLWTDDFSNLLSAVRFPPRGEEPENGLARQSLHGRSPAAPSKGGSHP